MKNIKRIAVLGLVICVWALSCYALFYFCRQHKIIIDNRSVEAPDGKTYPSLPEVLVAINNDLSTDETASPTLGHVKEVPFISFCFWPAADTSITTPLEMMARERALVKVSGPSFNLKMEVRDRMGQPIEHIEKNIHLGGRRDAMLRLVKIKNGLDGFIEDFPDASIKAVSTPPDSPDRGVSGHNDEPVTAPDGEA